MSTRRATYRSDASGAGSRWFCPDRWQPLADGHERVVMGEAAMQQLLARRRHRPQVGDQAPPSWREVSVIALSSNTRVLSSPKRNQQGDGKPSADGAGSSGRRIAARGGTPSQSTAGTLAGERLGLGRLHPERIAVNAGIVTSESNPSRNCGCRELSKPIDTQGVGREDGDCDPPSAGPLSAFV